jgi:hypothetical protein
MSCYVPDPVMKSPDRNKHGASDRGNQGGFSCRLKVGVLGTHNCLLLHYDHYWLAHPHYSRLAFVITLRKIEPGFALKPGDMVETGPDHERNQARDHQQVCDAQHVVCTEIIVQSRQAEVDRDYLSERAPRSVFRRLKRFF